MQAVGKWASRIRLDDARGDFGKRFRRQDDVDFERIGRGAGPRRARSEGNVTSSRAAAL
jgi:hypothetical protein